MDVDGESIEDKTDEELLAIASKAQGELHVCALGPWGCYEKLRDVGLFEALADAAPGAYFSGGIGGYCGDEKLSLNAELNNGILRQCEYDHADCMERYEKRLREKLLYSLLCELFHLDKAEFSEDDYNNVISDVTGDFGDVERLAEMLTDEVSGYVKDFKMGKKELKKIIEKMDELGITGFDEFSEGDYSDIYVDEYPKVNQ